MDDEDKPEDVSNYLAKNRQILKEIIKEEPILLENLIKKIRKRDRDWKDQNKIQEISHNQNPTRNYVDNKEKNKIGFELISTSSSSSDHRHEDLLKLVLDVCNVLDLNTLVYRIVISILKLVNVSRCSLYLVKGSKEEKFLEACLLNVTLATDFASALEEVVLTDSIPFSDETLGAVATSGKTAQYHVEDDKIICLPIYDCQEQVSGVLQIFNNKKDPQHVSQNDIKFCERYLSYCGVAIQKAQLYETRVREYEQNQLLLNLAKSLFQEQTSLDRLITNIIVEAKKMLNCERCTIFLLDLKMYDQIEQDAWNVKESLAVLASTAASNSQNNVSLNSSRFVPGELTDDTSSQTSIRDLKEEALHFKVAYELIDEKNETIRFDCDKIENAKRLKIAYYVAQSAEVLNLDNVSKWFECENLVEDDGFEPKSMLTIPIVNSQSAVIGVAQLINKLNGQMFDEKDIEKMEAFAMFCGIGIHNTKTYESTCKLMAKQRVALDCLSYHATATDNDTTWLARETIPVSKEFNLYSYKFNDTLYQDSITLKIVIRMFLDFDLINKFSIPYKVVCRWALSVKKNYRPVKYHNWRHALNVCQTMFSMLKTGKMDRFMDDLEVFGLLVACLCHDLDHRGTNNSYQTKVDSPLAILYSTSTMEHHHFDQCVMILSSDGNNIFQGLSTEDYKKVMTVLEQAILATDLASYFEKRDKFKMAADDGEIDWQAEDKKKLLSSMLMTAADVAAIAKPWELQHETAKQVADEFFDQGDMERMQLGINPMWMMDRERKDELPQMQVEFIDRVCTPLYTILSESFPWVKPLLDGALANRSRWADLEEKVKMGLTWIDHDIIEVPVEDVEAGTIQAEGLNLTIETFKQRDDSKLDVETGLVKKRSFRSIRSPVRPPQVGGFFTRKLSAKQKTTPVLLRASLSHGHSTDIGDTFLETRELCHSDSDVPDQPSPPDIIISQQ